MVFNHKFLLNLAPLFVAALAFLSGWSSVLAQGGSNTGGGGGANEGGGGGYNPGPDSVGGGGLTNPLKSDSLLEFLQQVIDIILVFALPIIVFFIMYGGFKLVMAQGEPGELQKGRDAILWAVVGGVIILGAKLILEVINGTVNSLLL